MAGLFLFIHINGESPGTLIYDTFHLRAVFSVTHINLKATNLQAFTLFAADLFMCNQWLPDMMYYYMGCRRIQCGMPWTVCTSRFIASTSSCCSKQIVSSAEHVMKKLFLFLSIHWKSVGSSAVYIEKNIWNILQNVVFCVTQKEESHPCFDIF